MFDPSKFQGIQWGIVPIIIFGRYVLMAGIAYLIFYVWKRRALLFRKIQQRFPHPADYWREVGYSAITSLVFSAMAWLCLGTPLRQYTQFYSDIHQYSIAWLLLSIPLAIVIHDTYFYWAHRLMHHPVLYRRMHLTHHLSVNPSPWAAFAFHPLEALAEAAIIPILLFAIPIHPLAFLAFTLFMLLFNVYGHLGYELFPKKTYEHPLGQWLNSSVYHNLHHEKFQGNYGLYFTFWDKYCGTLRADSAEKVAQVHAQIDIGKNYEQTRYNSPSTNSILDNMSKKMLLSALLSACAIAANAQLNWATDIAPILYENCAKCHRDGGLGHFSLVGYNNAFSNRFEIQDATTAKRMPPWKPDPSYRRYAHENRLDDSEIQRISDWVDGGAVAGDLSQAPADPVFSDESEVGIPDRVLLTPFYTVTATDDEYRCFVIPNGLNQVAYLRGLEAIPGNHEVVHHILVYEDTTGQGKILDAQTPNEPGYVNFGGPGVDGARLVGAWVPGAQTTLVPPFMGVKLTPGHDLIVQMHYPKGVTGMSDQTRINLFFTPGTQGVREIRLAPILNHTPLSLENGPLNIPANTVKDYHAKFTVFQNASVISVGPHMHLIGRNIVCFGVTLQNDTIPLIRINDWDFHWQGGYFLQKLQKLPIGTKLHAYATYDNTTGNPHQPSDPPQLVTQGESTTDEMMLVYFAFLAYEPGDENIVLDSTLLSTGLPFIGDKAPVEALQIFPNPASEQVSIQFELPEKTNYRVSIVDQQGRIVRSLAEKVAAMPGICREVMTVTDLAPGAYFVEVQTSRAEVFTGRFVKQ